MIFTCEVKIELILNMTKNVGVDAKCEQGLNNFLFGHDNSAKPIPDTINILRAQKPHQAIHT